MVYVVGELALGARFLFYGVHGHGVLALLSLKSLKPLVVHMYNLASDVAQLIVWVVHRRDELGVVGRTFGHAAENTDVAPEVACGKESEHRHGYGHGEHHEEDAVGGYGGTEYVVVEGKSCIYHHAPVIAACT